MFKSISGCFHIMLTLLALMLLAVGVSDSSGQSYQPYNRCVEGTFLAEYYDADEKRFQVRCEEYPIKYDWGTGSSSHGDKNLRDELSVEDNYRVLWRGRFPFKDAGRYRFHAHVDDRIRIKVNDKIVLERWFDQPRTSYDAEVRLTAGVHKVYVEYYENTGDAVVNVWWEYLGR